VSTETFEFERKYRVWLDDFYKERGFSIQRISGKDNEKYDVILGKEDRQYFVEEKGAQYLHQDMVIELVQDLWTQNWGWYYKTEANFIMYFYFDNGNPKVLYKVKMKELRNLFEPMCGDNGVKLGITDKNYGCTLNAYIAWELLLAKKVAEETWKGMRTCRKCNTAKVFEDGLCSDCYWGNDGWNNADGNKSLKGA